jgi:nondiscriminating glutamyl-tRNA synthetase
MRVRFAASLARAPHLRPVHTALFNWLFARSQGGSLVLCDVDANGHHEQRAETLGTALRWLGIDWDEGPDQGGPYGPYATAARLELYRRCAQALIDSGNAYRCYCTRQRLAEMRRRQLARQEPVRYDGYCQTLTADQRAALRRQGIASMVRLRVPRQGQTAVHDGILPDRVVENALLDDCILIRRDGRPTRHLIDAVDDRHMAITHVLLGHEWLPYAPYRTLLNQALGWEPPQYAHLPPAGGLDSCDQRAYLPLALVNELARLGWMPRGKQALLTMDELASRFELERVSRRPVALDLQRLDWFNHRCLRALDGAAAADLFVRRWQAAYGLPDRAGGTALRPEEWRQVLARAILDDIRRLDQAVPQARFAFTDEVVYGPDAREVLAQPYALAILHAFAQGLPSVSPFDYDAINAFVSQMRWQFKASLGIRSRDTMYVIRAALTGHMHGPCLVVACQLLGQQRCVERAQKAIGYCFSMPDVI